MSLFRYDAAILERFPEIVGGVLAIDDVRSDGVSGALADEYAAEQRAVVARLGDMALSELPSLAAWRMAFRRFDVDPTKYRSAAEALLRRLTKKGDIPSINPLVDIGNLVSIRYGLPVAVIDRRAIVDGITVCLANGSEQTSMLGQDDGGPVQPGEVIFRDGGGHVIARRWCWRQSMESAASAGTTAALITVEGLHADAAGDIARALDDLAALAHAHTGARVSARGVLGVGKDAL